MGGRGTFAKGNSVPYVYKATEMIEDVKVLKGINGKHSLPEESHSGWAYIKLKHDGTFHEMRIYDKDHYLVQEIAYHPEPKINNGNKTENILHIHDYQRDDFKNRPARLLTLGEIEKYKKYFKGVDLK